MGPTAQSSTAKCTLNYKGSCLYSSWATCCCVVQQREQTTVNSRENYSVIWFTLAVSKTSEHLPKLLRDAFTGDKPPGNGSLGSLGSVVQTVCHGTERINNHHFHFLFMVLITDDKTSSKFKNRGRKKEAGIDCVPFLRLKCLWDSLLGNKRELKLWRIWKCVWAEGWH